MRPEDVRTPEDFQQWLAEQDAARAEYYRTPTWERVLLWIVLALMVLVIVAGLASAVLG